MMLNESFEKIVQPRDPEKAEAETGSSCGSVYSQGASPVVYEASPVAGSRSSDVKYLPEDTLALSVSECVLMLLVQLIPVVGLVMAAVWSFSPASGINKRTVARALLVVQIIVLAVIALAWAVGLLR